MSPLVSPLALNLNAIPSDSRIMQVLSSEMVGGHLSNWLYRPQFSWICWDSGPKAIYVSHCFVSIFSRPWIVIAERRFSNVWLLTNLAKVMSTFFTSQFTSRRKKWARGNEILIQISCQHVLNIPNSSQFWSQLSWQTCFVLGNSRADRRRLRWSIPTINEL